MNKKLKNDIKNIADGLVERMLEEFYEGAEAHFQDSVALQRTDEGEIADALVEAFCEVIKSRHSEIVGTIQVLQEYLAE